MLPRTRTLILVAGISGVMVLFAPVAQAITIRLAEVQGDCVTEIDVELSSCTPDGSKIVAGGNGEITVYDEIDLKILFQNANAHHSRVNGVAFSPDGSMISSGGDDGALKLWFLGTPRKPVNSSYTESLSRFAKKDSL